jgi:hypothetical protein
VDFYLFGFPLIIAFLIGSLLLTVFKGVPLPALERLALVWLINYSLANVWFVWCWRYGQPWREGLLLVSTGLVLIFTLGLVVMAEKVRRASSFRWIVWLLYGCLVFINIPILMITILRGAAAIQGS